MFAGGRQTRARLVAHEHGAVEVLFQTANTRADRGLGQIEVRGGADEAAGLDHFQECARDLDIHRSCQ